MLQNSLPKMSSDLPVTSISSTAFPNHVQPHTQQQHDNLTSKPSVSAPALLSVSDYAAYAQRYLPKSAYDYYSSGANDQITLLENTAAYSRLRIRPRFLVDVSKVTLTTSILGHRISSPICIAPTAMHRMAHPDGEKATIRAAHAHNTCMILSSLSTTSLEEVAAAASPAAFKWFQLYVYSDREVTKSLVQRAEKAGYSAIVVTVDTPLLGVRESDVRNNFALPSHLSLANFADPRLSTEKITTETSGSGLQSYIAGLFDRALTWKDITWLKTITKLPIIVKGVLTAEDAALAVEAGVAAIIVSNHGARQLDGVAATIEALPEVVEAVKNSDHPSVEIYLDGGIRRGTDVFKAVALGARAVFIGRPILYGLSYAGEQGARQILTILNNELELAMTLAGTPNIGAINKCFVASAQALRPKL
jgi:(S)-2-hydroxy-acid oxidase